MRRSAAACARPWRPASLRRRWAWPACLAGGLRGRGLFAPVRPWCVRRLWSAGRSPAASRSSSTRRLADGPRRRLACSSSLRQAGLGDHRVAAGLARALSWALARAWAVRAITGIVARALVVLQAPGGLPAVDARQREVHQDDVGQQLERLLQGLQPVGRGRHAEAAELQVLGEDLAAVIDVVDHQHEGAGLPLSSLMSRLGSAGQEQGEGGALAQTADQGDAAAEKVGQPAADGQARGRCRRGRRAYELSACSKASKMVRWFSSGDADAGVGDRDRDLVGLAQSCSRRMETEPWGVNLRAFESRLRTICLTFWRSLSSSGRSGSEHPGHLQAGARDQRLDLGHHLVDQLAEAARARPGSASCPTRCGRCPAGR